MRQHMRFWYIRKSLSSLLKTYSYQFIAQRHGGLQRQRMYFNSRHAYIVHVCMLVTDRAMAFVLMAYCACGIDRFDETAWMCKKI